MFTFSKEKIGLTGGHFPSSKNPLYLSHFELSTPYLCGVRVNILLLHLISTRFLPAREHRSDDKPVDSSQNPEVSWSPW